MIVIAPVRSPRPFSVTLHDEDPAALTEGDSHGTTVLSDSALLRITASGRKHRSDTGN